MQLLTEGGETGANGPSGMPSRGMTRCKWRWRGLWQCWVWDPEGEAFGNCHRSPLEGLPGGSLFHLISPHFPRPPSPQEKAPSLLSFTLSSTYTSPMSQLCNIQQGS
jgi:hypothetical protein